MSYPYGVSRMGLDPELAITNMKTGESRSAHLLLGDRVEQFKFRRDNETQGGRLGSEVSRDGPGIEVRSLIESACRDNIIPYLGEAIRWTQLQVEKKMKGFTLSSAAKYVLDDESLKNAPPNVSEFGCNPDYSAYTLSEKSPDLDSSDRRRWTGGHIHASQLSAANNNLQEQAAIAIAFDYFVAMPMVAILGNKFEEGEAERRQIYGQPGSFRYDDKIGKIEFRTLSGRVLLHPTILAWCMGMVKSFLRVIPSGGAVDFIKELRTKMPLELVYDAIEKHDVTAARNMSEQVFKLLPSYNVDDAVLGNPMGGGGGGTTNPYFFERSWDVYVRAGDAGIMWDDDMVFNWGLYDNYEIKHHAYWGIQVAMSGRCDDLIFPMNAILKEVWPKSALYQGAPIYTHPTVGGDKQYVTPAAAAWLA